MVTKADLDRAIDELQEKLNFIATELKVQAHDIAVLEAKVLQFQANPSIPVTFRAEFTRIQESLKAIADSIVVPEESPVESAEVE